MVTRQPGIRLRGSDKSTSLSPPRSLEEGLTRLKIRRQELLLRLKQDYMEQAEVLSRAIVIFEEISSQLYERPSKFTPTETSNGPAFKIEAQADRSPGIANLQIFCSTLCCPELWLKEISGLAFWSTIVTSLIRSIHGRPELLLSTPAAWQRQSESNILSRSTPISRSNSQTTLISLHISLPLS